MGQILCLQVGNHELRILFGSALAFLAGTVLGAAAFADEDGSFAWGYGTGLGGLMFLGGIMIGVGWNGNRTAAHRRLFNLILAFLHTTSLIVFVGILQRSGTWEVFSTVQTSAWEVYNMTCQGNVSVYPSPLPGCIVNNTNVSCADSDDATGCAITMRTEKAGTVSVEYLVIAFHAMSALHHLLISWKPRSESAKQKPFKKCWSTIPKIKRCAQHILSFYDSCITLQEKYEEALTKNSQPYRWIEYGLSAPMQQVCFLLLTGVVDAYVLICAGVLTGVTMTYGYLSERAEFKGNSRLFVYSLGWIPYTASWIPALWSYWLIANPSGKRMRDPPEWLAVLLIVEIMLFTSFALVQLKMLVAIQRTATQSSANADDQSQSFLAPRRLNNYDQSRSTQSNSSGLVWNLDEEGPPRNTLAEAQNQRNEWCINTFKGLLIGLTAGVIITAVSTGGFSVNSLWVYITSIGITTAVGLFMGFNWNSWTADRKETPGQYYEWFYGVLSFWAKTALAYLFAIGALVRKDNVVAFKPE